MAKTALFFDTETTGIPRFQSGPGSPSQPHIVQLAYILADIGGRERASTSCIIRPDGWKVPVDAAAVHGIYTEDAERYGIPLRAAISGFAHTLMRADVLVAHNIGFDVFVIKCALHRLGSPDSARKLDEMPRRCTQEMSTQIVKIPPTAKMLAAGFDTYKAPRLEEAYRHIIGADLEGAHDALVDVRACRAIFEEMYDDQ